MFPVACIFLSVTERQENEGISVAVYIETAQPGNEGFLNTLSHTLITRRTFFFWLMRMPDPWKLQ